MSSSRELPLPSSRGETGRPDSSSNSPRSSSHSIRQNGAAHGLSSLPKVSSVQTKLRTCFCCTLATSPQCLARAAEDKLSRGPPGWPLGGGQSPGVLGRSVGSQVHSRRVAGSTIAGGSSSMSVGGPAVSNEGTQRGFCLEGLPASFWTP